MLVIRTADEMARALDSPLDPELKQALSAHLQRLSEYDDYDLSELAQFVIIQPGDTIDDLSSVLEVDRGEGRAAPSFTLCPEVIEQHTRLTELVFILSDDGFGTVLFIPTGPDTNPLILELANSHAD